MAFATTCVRSKSQAMVTFDGRGPCRGAHGGRPRVYLPYRLPLLSALPRPCQLEQLTASQPRTRGRADHANRESDILS